MAVQAGKARHCSHAISAVPAVLNLNPGLVSAKKQEPGEPAAWLMLNQGLFKEKVFPVLLGTEEEWCLCGRCWRVLLASFLATTCLPPQQQHGADRLD